MTEELQRMLNQKVLVLANDGRVFIGMLRGADQVTNVVLEDVEERILSTTNEMEVDKYDVYLFRGDDITMIGLYNEEKDKEIDWSTIRADAINPIQHSCVCYKQFLN